MRQKESYGKRVAQLDRLNSIMQEDVSGLRIIKACVRELYEKARFGKANDELIKIQLPAQRKPYKGLCKKSWRTAPAL